jgi:hypothetical protein
MNHSKFCLLLSVALLASGSVLAQGAPGPIPTAITSARTIFVSNGGGEASLFPEPFSGDPSRGYNELYAALKASGQYQLVDNPTQADLVLEIRLASPPALLRQDIPIGKFDPLPMFTLTIYDRSTHYVLWTLTRTVDYAILQKTHDRNFDQAIDAIASQFEALSGKPAKTP